jgi:hypothetical protein
MDISVSPLGQTDIGIYVRTGVAAYFSPTTTATFSLVCISDGVHTHIAKPAEVVRGKTILPNGKKFNLAPSEEAQARGYRTVLRGPEADYVEAALHQFLRLSVYSGLGLKALFLPPILTALCIFVALFPYCIYLDIKRTKLMKYGRLLPKRTATAHATCSSPVDDNSPFLRLYSANEFWIPNPGA